MVVASLIAVFALGAVVAGPALAKKAHVPGTLEGEWKPYSHCPIYNPEFLNPPAEFGGLKHAGGEQIYCLFGQTAGGKEGGSFTVGGVSVPLNKKITIQGGLVGYETSEGRIDGHLVAPEGSELLEAIREELAR